MVVKAVYENGVFRPTGAVLLPEHSEVEFEPRLVSGSMADGKVEAKKAVLATLSQRVSEPGGPVDLSERHNEHQP